MLRSSWIAGLLACFVGTGCCSTHVKDQRQAGPQPASAPAIQAGAGAEPSAVGSRVVPLSAANTRVTFVGTAGPTSHEGGFDQLSGGWSLATEDPKDSRLSVQIETASVRTRIGLMTTHLKREDFFDVKQFPTATFSSTRIEPQTGPAGTNYQVTGNFTIHGVTQAMTFPARIAITSEAVSLDARLIFSQTAFGMAKSAEKTRDEVPVTISVNASRR
jgi:polyisoprenoid-binding protein YceI